MKSSQALFYLISSGCFAFVDFNFNNSVTIPPKIYSPRPEQCLQFYPKDSETVKYSDSARKASDKKVSCIGQQNTTPVCREYFLSFQVLFQPGAFYRVTGIPMYGLANVYLDAEDIFSTGVREVNEQWFVATSYSGMIEVVEKFLCKLIRKTCKQEHQ